jgi:hypothetical protein
MSTDFIWWEEFDGRIVVVVFFKTFLQKEDRTWFREFLFG